MDWNNAPKSLPCVWSMCTCLWFDSRVWNTESELALNLCKFKKHTERLTIMDLGSTDSSITKASVESGYNPSRGGRKVMYKSVGQYRSHWEMSEGVPEAFSHLRNHVFQYRLASFCTIYCFASSLEGWAGAHDLPCIIPLKCVVPMELFLWGNPTWSLTQLGKNGCRPHTVFLCKALAGAFGPSSSTLRLPENGTCLSGTSLGVTRDVHKSVKLCKQ